MENKENGQKLNQYMTPVGTWAFSIGTSIGWGSFVVTCSTYLNEAGLYGTIIGLLLGMAVILVITKNVCRAIEAKPDAGGIYSYVKEVCGYDHAFLIAWFLLLTYLAILWANITSLPLFARRFVGDIFRFGRLYTVFGYEVYMGEVLLSIAALVIVAVLIMNSTKIPQVLMIIMAVTFVGVLVITTVYAFTTHDASFSYDPAFVPDKTALAQIVRIAVISPWAFIGFENVAHFSEEYAYPLKRIRRILLVSVLLTTLVYVLMTILSVSAYPPAYSNWLEYIRDMENLSGIEAIPAFYAVSVYMGNTGVSLMLIALLCVIITSIIGNLTALSRLLYSIGRSGMAPASLGETNRRGIPQNAITVIVIISMCIPLMGRTAIGWIVDVTTLGATILYGFLSYAVIKDAGEAGDRNGLISGIAGSVLMVGFVVLLLAPKLVTYDAMHSESYFIFAVWSLLGLLVFRIVMQHDKNHVYGRSVIVWMMFLLLILLTTMMWVNRETQSVTEASVKEIRQYYEVHLSNGGKTYDGEKTDRFLREHADRIENVDARNTIFSYGLFILSVMIMLNNYRISRKREKEWQEALGAAQLVSMTDPLTGVKNRHAFFRWADDLDSRIEKEKNTEFAIVVCDINDLKAVNDTLGHKAGDECIRLASTKICHIFSHSPVFRYGGDEFVVILEGEDNERHEDLMRMLRSISDKAKRENENTIAAGISVYDPKIHRSMLSVFEEADKAMYENKRKMKGLA